MNKEQKNKTTLPMPKGIRLILTIVDRGKGKKVCQAFSKIGCKEQTILLGKGTASKEIFEYIGFGSIEKDVVLSIAPLEIVPYLLDELRYEMDFNDPGKGISCTIPVDSIAGARALAQILGADFTQRKVEQ
jgi:hypothetical protein